MKYLVVSTLLSAGLMLYLSAGSLGSVTSAGLSTIPKQEETIDAKADSASEENDEVSAAHDLTPAAAEEQLVQIQGKWHKYRADNRYVIDGVPTFHIAKKRQAPEAVRKEPARVPASVQVAAASEDMKTSQELLKMVGENPLKAYTPEGFKTLKAGLDALKNSNADRKKTLEELSREQ